MRWKYSHFGANPWFSTDVDDPGSSPIVRVGFVLSVGSPSGLSSVKIRESSLKAVLNVAVLVTVGTFLCNI